MVLHSCFQHNDVRYHDCAPAYNEDRVSRIPAIVVERGSVIYLAETVLLKWVVAARRPILALSKLVLTKTLTRVATIKGGASAIHTIVVSCRGSNSMEIYNWSAFHTDDGANNCEEKSHWAVIRHALQHIMAPTVIMSCLPPYAYRHYLVDLSEWSSIITNRLGAIFPVILHFADHRVQPLF